MGDMVATAPRLLVEARRRAGISQAELARRAGVPRSVVNAYERGHREPGADALARLLDATGLRLTLGPALRRPDEARAGRILEQVLDLAEHLPTRRRGALQYPVLPRRAAR
jgi:transcriptional regulator with XRE-family HTH domain